MTSIKESVRSEVSPAEEDGPLDSVFVTTREQASKLIKRYSAASAGLSLIPVPILDVSAVGSAQFLMVSGIAKIYGKDLSNERVKAIVTTTIGSLGPMALGGVVGSMIKVVPIIGTVVGSVTMPSFAGLATLTLGNVLASHLDQGGALDELDIPKMRELFKVEFQAAKAKLSRKKPASSDAPEPIAA